MNRIQVWNTAVKIDDEVWYELRWKGLMNPDRLPTYQMIIKGDEYSERWKTCLTMMSTGQFDRNFTKQLKATSDGRKCYVCKCDSHDLHQCLFMKFAVNCNHITNNKRRNVFDKSNFNDF